MSNAAALKKAALVLGGVLIALLVVVVLFAAYGIQAERAAARKADSLCASLSPGDEAGGLRDRAIAEGASERQTRWMSADGVDTLFITFVGIPPFSRHQCYVKAQDGRVISATRGHLD